MSVSRNKAEGEPPVRVPLGRCVEPDHDAIHEKLPSCDQWYEEREAPDAESVVALRLQISEMSAILVRIYADGHLSGGMPERIDRALGRWRCMDCTFGLHSECVHPECTCRETPTCGSPPGSVSHSAGCGTQPAGSGCICGVGFVRRSGERDSKESPPKDLK